MIKIAISVEAFEAIARTLPLGSVGYEAEPNERGERTVWLEAAMADRLGAMRGPGESYSDVILRRSSGDNWTLASPSMRSNSAASRFSLG